MVYQSLNMRRYWVSALCFTTALLVSCADTGPKSKMAQPDPPSAPREFRAVWVATVANIDWPSKRDLTVLQQQTEIIGILDRAKQLNLNAIVLQVRTSADALYESKLEPWSEYLTGTQGSAPEPYYDPLKMWVDEAHARGLELHAWFNPYRARHTQAKSPTARTHVSNTMPQAVKSYGGFLWMDPGEAAASDHTLNVILDVVRRYDIDGVHIDDYFYPYPVPVPGTDVPPPSADDTPQPRAELPFPDEPAWQSYLSTGGKMNRADWRRQNVNALIERIHTGIKREKPLVKFGISPFGLGKPEKRPAGIAGFSQYDKLYADAELWLQKGWLDYFTPQLYWAIEQKAQAYGVLLDYWAKENTLGRHLWPGIYTSRINDTDKSWMPDEIVNQITMTRQKGMTDPLVTGHVHFSMVAMAQNRKGINDALKQNLYQTPALVPASPWLDAVAPPAPSVRTTTRSASAKAAAIEVQPAKGEAADKFAVWVAYAPAIGTGTTGVVAPPKWTFQIVANTAQTGATSVLLPRLDADNASIVAVVVSAVDRAGNESARVHLSTADIVSMQ